MSQCIISWDTLCISLMKFQPTSYEMKLLTCHFLFPRMKDNLPILGAVICWLFLRPLPEKCTNMIFKKMTFTSNLGSLSSMIQVTFWFCFIPLTHSNLLTYTGCLKNNLTFLLLNISKLIQSNFLSFQEVIQYCYTILSSLILGSYDDYNQSYDI